MMSLHASRNLVGTGSVPPRSAYSCLNVGTMNSRIAVRISTTMIATMTG